MYSVVLMMAMTTSVDAPDLHRHGGCSGSAGCSGYAGGSGYAGCSGAASCGGHERHKLFGGRHHGCHGGSGCSGYGGCSGGYGAPVGCSGGYGGGYGAPVGCSGGSGGYGAPVGCSGGVIVMPAAPAVKPETVKPPKGEEAFRNAPATIVVSLPAEAKLSIDNALTTSTSAERVFQSPELPAGRDFSYTLKAEFQFEGKPVVVTKKVSVRAGIESRVTIGAADLAGVASR